VKYETKRKPICDVVESRPGHRPAPHRNCPSSVGTLIKTCPLENFQKKSCFLFPTSLVGYINHIRKVDIDYEPAEKMDLPGVAFCRHFVG
jgi:hypothetical protein